MQAALVLLRGEHSLKRIQQVMARTARQAAADSFPCLVDAVRRLLISLKAVQGAQVAATAMAQAQAQAKAEAEAQERARLMRGEEDEDEGEDEGGGKDDRGGRGRRGGDGGRDSFDLGDGGMQFGE